MLPIIRKVFSNITLKRIQTKGECFLSQSQSAYRPNRSTADVVLMHRWLAARVQKFEEEIHIIGIGLSAAFDTIRRQTLLDNTKNFLERRRLENDTYTNHQHKSRNKDEWKCKNNTIYHKCRIDTKRYVKWDTFHNIF